VLFANSLPVLPVQQVEADTMNFDEGLLRLTGHVKIEHELGTLYCEEGVLVLPQQKSSGGGFEVEKIMLRGDVNIFFSDGGKLSSEEGDLDCRTLDVVFHCALPKKVVYIGTAMSGSTQVPVRAMSHTLTAKIVKGESGYTLGSLRGEGAVNIEYLHKQPSGESCE
jgi:hypothetical protein